MMAVVQCTRPEESETEREKGGGGGGGGGRERVPRGQVSKTPSPQCTKAMAYFKDIF